MSAARITIGYDSIMLYIFCGVQEAGMDLPSVSVGPQCGILA